MPPMLKRQASSSIKTPGSPATPGNKPPGPRPLQRNKTVSGLIDKKQVTSVADELDIMRRRNLLDDTALDFENWERRKSIKEGGGVPSPDLKEGRQSGPKLVTFKEAKAMEKERIANSAPLNPRQKRTADLWQRQFLRLPQETKKWTNLHRLAAKVSRDNEVQDFLDFKREVRMQRDYGSLDVKDEEGHTPLMLAVVVAWAEDGSLESQFKKVDFLVTRGANPFLWNADNETALSMADAKNWHAAVLRMLYATSAFTNFRLWSGLVNLKMVRDEMAALHAPSKAREDAIAAVLHAFASYDDSSLWGEVIDSFIASRELETWRAAMLNTLQWAIEAKELGQRRMTTNPMAADSLNHMSLNLQLAVGGAITHLNGVAGEDEFLYTKAGEMMRWGTGRMAFTMAVSGELKAFLSGPTVQRFVSREWRGQLLDMYIEDDSVFLSDEKAFPVALALNGVPMGLILIFCTVANLFLLPVITLVPPLEDGIVRALGRSQMVYMLDSPAFKYFLASSFDLGLAILLTIYYDGRNSLAIDVFFQVWTAMGVWSELLELLTAEKTIWDSIRIAFLSRLYSGVRSAYFSITLNWLDLPANILASAALALRIRKRLEMGEELWYLSPATEIAPTGGVQSLQDALFVDRSLESWQVVLGPALLLIWMRQLRVLLSISVTGPLVLMIIRMFRDVGKWLTVMIVIFLAFSAAFLVLTPKCEPYLMSESSTSIYFPLPIRLLDGTIAGTLPQPEECMLHQDSTSAIGLTLGYAFLMFANVLMLNLLIAFLSKTFDSISEASITNYQLLRAQLTVNFREGPAAPPAIRILRLPYEILSMLQVCGCAEAEESSMPSCALPMHDFFSMVRGLKPFVNGYCFARQDDAGGDERWRLQLNKAISRKLAGVETRVAEQMQRTIAKLETQGKLVDDRLNAFNQSLESLVKKLAPETIPPEPLFTPREERAGAVMIASTKSFLDRRFQKTVNIAANKIQTAGRRYLAKGSLKRQRIRVKSQLKTVVQDASNTPLSVDRIGMMRKEAARKASGGTPKPGSMRVLTVSSPAPAPAAPAAGITSTSLDMSLTSMAYSSSSVPASSTSTTPREAPTRHAPTAPAALSIEDEDIFEDADMVTEELAAQKEARRLQAERDEISAGLLRHLSNTT